MLLYHTFQTSEQSPDSVIAPSTNHKQQGRRTEVLRQATNRKPALECTRGRVGVSVRSKGRTDGKSVRRMHFFHTACDKHDWTCTVPWHVFQLCVRTLQLTVQRHTWEWSSSRRQETHAPWHGFRQSRQRMPLEQKLETSQWKVNDKNPKP